MTPEFYARVKQVFGEALERPPDERAAFLGAACNGDSVLRNEVDALLAAHGASEAFLQEPAARLTDDVPLAPAPPVGAPSPDASVPHIFANRYEMQHEIGRGGMGVVYLAHDLHKDRRAVAVKMLRPEIANRVNVARFMREARIAKACRHARILPLLDVGEADGRPYFVTPWVDGESLRQRLARERQLPVDDALHITVQIAEALAAAHARGVLHRDVTPGNILLCGGDAFLADFGIARAVTNVDDERLTSTGLVIGTPAYMSPEQGSADRNLDARSDLYALASVLYEMLAGQPPFTGATTQSVLAQKAAHEPQSVRRFRPSVPEYVDRALARTLQPVPADRFGSTCEFAAALRGGDATPATPTLSTPNRRTSRRTIAVMASVPLLTLAALALARVRHPAPVPSAAPADVTLRRLAVADFDAPENSDASTEFARGLREALLYELHPVEALTVITTAGSTCRADSGGCDSVLRRLDVGTVVRATVQHSDSSFLVTVHLLDRATGVDLATSVYQRPRGDLIVAQRELAAQIAGDLRGRLGRLLRARAAVRGTDVPRARDLVMRAQALRDDARAMADGRDREDVAAARDALAGADSALRLARQADPRWVRPLLDRGWVARELAALQPEKERRPTLDEGLAFADSVLRVDSLDAGGLELRGTLQLAVVELYDPQAPDFPRMRLAERDLERAVTLDSTLANAWSTLSFVHTIEGAFKRAEIDALRARGRDLYLDKPQDILNRSFNAELMLGQFAGATETCARGRRLYAQDIRFVQCELTLMRHDPAARPDARRAWALVAKLDSIDPPANAAIAGHPYLPLYRRVVAATISARAGAPGVLRTELRRAELATAGDPGLRMDLAYDAAVARAELGDHATAEATMRELLAARPMLRPMYANDPLLVRVKLAKP